MVRLKKHLKHIISVSVVAVAVFFFVNSACALNFEADTTVITADTITFSFSDDTLFVDYTYEASAEFKIVGDQLQITLTNTSGDDVDEQIQLLAAVWWDMDATGVTAESAIVPDYVISISYTSSDDNTVWFDTIFPTADDTSGDVSSEFSFGDSLGVVDAGGDTAQFGVSASGFGLPYDQIPIEALPGDISLDSPLSGNGANYGITSAGDDTSTGQSQVTGGPGAHSNETPLIQNTVVFLLSGDGFDLDSIYNVSFEYGTSLGGTSVPEPTTILLLGSGLVGLALSRRRFKKETDKTS